MERFQLDNLSREDLVRFVKKQLAHLAEARKEISNERNAFQIEKREIEEAFAQERRTMQKRIDDLEEKQAMHTAEEQRRNETNSQNELELESRQKFASAMAEVQMLRQCLNDRAALYEEVRDENDQLTQKLQQVKEERDHVRLIGNVRKGGFQQTTLNNLNGAARVFEQDANRQVEDEKRITRLKNELTERELLLSQVRSELHALKSLHREQSTLVEQLSDRDAKSREEIAHLRASLDDKMQELNAVKERRSVVTAINLEMADYERSITRLQNDLKAANELAESRAAEIVARDAERRNLQDEKTRLDAGNAKLKAVVVKLKKDLENKRVECEALTTEMREITAQRDAMHATLEASKLETGNMLAIEQQRLLQLETAVASLDRQLQTVRAQRENIQQQYDDLLEEHNRFKERAHTVLKQQQRVTNDEDQKEQMQTLQKTISDLQTTLDNAMIGYRSAQDELSAMREHSDTLALQVQRLKNELTEKSSYFDKSLIDQRGQWESRLAVETALNVQLRSQLEQLGVNHDRERAILLAEHRATLAEMKKKMEELRNELQKNGETRASIASVETPVAAMETRRRSPKPLIACDHESTSSCAGSVTVSGGVDEDFLSLDELIRVERVDSRSPHEGGEDWRARAQLATRRMAHTTELLNDAEAANARLHEQIKLLKDEIRRLERNSEREQHLANCEYLKNVVMKFLAPQKVNDERPQLIPILTTMLRLGPDEIALLNKVAASNLTNTGAISPTSPGLSGYFHRWSGLS